MQSLFNMIDTTKVEENKYAACSAIGNIVSRNQSKLIPLLMKNAYSVKDVYLYIYIFKEMIDFNSNPFEHLN